MFANGAAAISCFVLTPGHTTVIFSLFLLPAQCKPVISQRARMI
jgi:hypothetical protein